MFSNTTKIILISSLSLVAFAAFACSKPATNSNSGSTTSTRPDRKPPTMTDVPVGNAQTPSEAYKMLFAAVKSQDPAKIKLMLSKDSLDGLAAMAAAQQKKTVEQVIENGFTETTFADNYPEMRDERIKDGNGAVEVWSEKSKRWEDIPFIWQDGSWKAAFGDTFSGKWKSPGKGQSVIEQENANANNPNAVVPAAPNINGNFNGAKRPPKKPGTKE